MAIKVHPEFLHFLYANNVKVITKPLMPFCPTKVRSSFWSSWTRDSTFPFDSYLTSVCNSKRTCWESISLHINS